MRLVSAVRAKWGALAAALLILVLGVGVHFEWATYTTCPSDWYQGIQICTEMQHRTGFHVVNIARFQSGVEHHHVALTIARPEAELFNFDFSFGEFDFGVLVLAPVAVLLYAYRSRLRAALPAATPRVAKWALVPTLAALVYITGPELTARAWGPSTKAVCPQGYDLMAGEQCQGPSPRYTLVDPLGGQRAQVPAGWNLSLYIERPSLRIFDLGGVSFEGFGTCHLEGERFTSRECD